MRIIISPAKKMNTNTDEFPVEGTAPFAPKTEQLMKWIQDLSWEELRELWKCNEKLLEQNFERFQAMELDRNLTPAVISYEGIQYQYMAPLVMEEGQLSYIRENLRIISAFYGLLSPFDGVVPYRLEMQAKIKGKLFPNQALDLYTFWGSDIYWQLTESDRVILNLASKEYSKAVEPYLTEEDTFVTCVFGELDGKKIVQKGTLAKMARGEMVNYLSSVNASSPEAAKGFNRLGFVFREDLSTEKELVFIK